MVALSTIHWSPRENRADRNEQRMRDSGISSRIANTYCQVTRQSPRTPTSDPDGRGMADVRREIRGRYRVDKENDDHVHPT
jgi:hypothetical protein